MFRRLCFTTAIFHDGADVRFLSVFPHRVDFPARLIARRILSGVPLMSYFASPWVRRLLAASTVAAFPAFVSAADEPAAPKPEHAAMFKKLDADGDGQITKDEVPEEQRRLLERLIANHDGNKDGKLSAAEFSAGLSEDRPRGDAPPPGAPGRPGAGGQGFSAEEFFKRIDRNGDGKVTLDEFPEERRENFKQMLARADEDKDGAATLEEFKKGFGGPGAGAPGRPSNPQAGNPQPGNPPQPGQPGRPGRPETVTEQV